LIIRNQDFGSLGVPTLWQEDLLAEANETPEVAEYIMGPTGNPDDVDTPRRCRLQLWSLEMNV